MRGHVPAKSSSVSRVLAGRCPALNLSPPTFTDRKLAAKRHRFGFVDRAEVKLRPIAEPGMVTVKGKRPGSADFSAKPIVRLVFVSDAAFAEGASLAAFVFSH